jgi:hypothetical protein
MNLASYQTIKLVLWRREQGALEMNSLVFWDGILAAAELGVRGIRTISSTTSYLVAELTAVDQMPTFPL